MSALRRLPALLALLMLGAHFLRFGQIALMVLCFGLLVPLFLLRPWAQVVVRGALALGTLVWLWTLAQDARERLAYGEPWLRPVIILGGVAAFTAWSAWQLRPRRTA